MTESIIEKIVENKMATLAMIIAILSVMFVFGFAIYTFSDDKKTSNTSN